MKKITDEIVNVSLAITPKIKEIILYGSYAREDNTDDSDIDVMILLDCTDEEYKELRKKISRTVDNVGYEHDMVVSPIVKLKQHFDEWLPYLPFYGNIQKEGVVLYG
ncbi:MAG: nucleotidyltransferase domain-containing protein [Phascolarctobacterium sp.]|nr:nucleotidyltransferase domain-containing protein [Candidatus Phascolarctobacterium equi]